jgi:lipid A ethanolaminephosphotransferase
MWLDNQSGCKGACDRVPTVHTRALDNPRWCANGECRDEVMLDALAKRMAQLPAAARATGVVLVLHQMGSHGPAYDKRVDPAF